MNILIKFPSRSRPEKFKSTLRRYIDFSSGLHNIRFICTFDFDDILMNSNEIKDWLHSQTTDIQYHYGYASNKIEAINANLENEIFDILILAADDLYPCRENYDDIIVKDMIDYHSDLDGCLHYMNPSWEERLDIGCIMTYLYYKRFNFIYHPSYKSIYCDNEYMETAKLLGKHRYIQKQLFEHNYVISDPTADRNWVFNNEDEQNYNTRKINNFYLNV